MSNPVKALVQRIRLWSRKRCAVRPLREDEYVKDRPADFNRLWSKQPEPLNRLNMVYLQAQLYLVGRDLRLSQEMIRNALTPALAEPDATANGVLLAKGADAAEKFMDERAERTGRRRYATSLYWGVVISLGLLVLIALGAILVIRLFLSLRGQTNIPDGTMSALRDVLVCIGGGTTGAVISTILRVSAAKQPIDYKVVTLRTAVFRIVLGWLFAAALLFLIKGTIISVFNVPESQPFFFWGGLGVLAGFNEAWARNLITRPTSEGQQPAPTGQPAS
jgi:hypothetical protein